MKRIFQILIISVISMTAYGQSDPLLTHFVFDKQSYNPAFVGSKENLDLGAIYRNQWWSGIDGAPKTANFYMNMPILNNRSGIGLAIVSDKIGFTKMFAADISYAYRMKMEKSTLALGLMGRIEKGSYDWEKADPNDVDDTEISGDGGMVGNIGAGIYFNTDNFYAGLSMPRLTKNSLYLKKDGFERKFNSFYLMAGYVMDVSNNMKFYPAALVSFNKDVPFEFELNGNLIFNDAFMVGASYRYQDAISGLLQYRFKGGLKAGFAVDFTASELKKATTGSFEVMVGYTLQCDDCKIVNLRYF